MNKRQRYAKYKKKVTVKKAVSVIVKALKKDKGIPGGYYNSWQANIAMAFVDNAAWFKKSNTGKRNVSNADIDRIANQAADCFLKQLMA